jgi:hypothetical protein
MASYASPDAKGRDVEIGIDAEYVRHEPTDVEDH